MTQMLTDKLVSSLPIPAKGNSITYDAELAGFGCRVTAGGSRSFILNYRTRAGRERRYTIGDVGTWKAAAARKCAKEIRRKLPDGFDPLAEIEAERGAKTIAAMCARFADEHMPLIRAKTRINYELMIKNEILPAIGKIKVLEVTPDHIDELHRKIGRGPKPRPYVANRVASLLSVMFNLAVRWRWCTANPCLGLRRSPEEKRKRYLSNEELRCLTTALAKQTDQQAANIIRLLLLTGARRNEVLTMRWQHLDLTAGIWTKPAADTKQKEDHTAPLSAPARQLLADIYQSRDPKSDFVFTGRWGAGRRVEIRRAWLAVCREAQITKLRLHDLRHSYASQLVSAGYSLPVIGALLGHSSVQTTSRYAHLFDEVTRAATERVGAIITGRPEAEVVPIRKPQR